MLPSLSTRNPLMEKQVQNFSSENNNSNNNNSGLSKLNGSDTTITSPSSNNTLDINQKYGFITGKLFTQLNYKRFLLFKLT